MFLLSCQRIKAHIYRPQTKFAKVMFLHLSVSHSVHRGGSASVHTGIPPHTHPRSRHPPGADTPPPPRTRHPPQSRLPLPGAETATAADGTHPTGMHSCCNLVSHIEKMSKECPLYRETPVAMDTLSGNSNFPVAMEKNFTCLSVQRKDILRRKL